MNSEKQDSAAPAEQTALPATPASLPDVSPPKTTQAVMPTISPDEWFTSDKEETAQTATTPATQASTPRRLIIAVLVAVMLLAGGGVAAYVKLRNNTSEEPPKPADASASPMHSDTSPSGVLSPDEAEKSNKEKDTADESNDGADTPQR